MVTPLEFIIISALLLFAAILGGALGEEKRWERRHKEWLESEEGKAHQAEIERQAKWRAQIKDDE